MDITKNEKKKRWRFQGVCIMLSLQMSLMY